MTEERYVTLDALLPPDPEPGEVFVMPENQVGGASTMNFIYVGGVCVGHTSQYARVANVSACSFLGRTVTSKPLVSEMEIRILSEQFTFRSLIYVEFFGWMVHEYDPKPQVLLDAKFTVLHAIPMRKPNSALYTYDRVCLQKYKEKTNVRTANGGASGNGPESARTNSTDATSPAENSTTSRSA